MFPARRAIGSGGSTKAIPTTPGGSSEARANSAAIVERRAEADRQGRVARASGEADAFTYRSSARASAPMVTDLRLYWDAIAKELAGKSKVILDADNTHHRHLIVPNFPTRAPSILTPGRGRQRVRAGRRRDPSATVPRPADLESNAEPATMKKLIRTLALVSLVSVVATVCVRSCVIVDETEYVLVTQFGRIVAVYGENADESGLHLKWPWQSSRAIDRRLQVFDPPAREMLTGDKRNLEVASYVVWRVREPVRFLQSAETLDAAEARLNERVSAALSSAVGLRDLAALASTDPKVWNLDALTDEVRRAVEAPAAAELGVEVVDVRLRRFNHPIEVRPAVFELIRSERRQVASTLRAEGEAQYQTLTSNADRQRDAVLAQADAEAERISGQGDAEATRLYNEAHARDPKFYEFVRTLDSYKAILDDEGHGRPVVDEPAAQAFDPGARRRAAERSSAGPLDDPAGAEAMRLRVVWGLVALVGLAAYLGTGWVVVAPGEAAVVRRLGQVLPRPWKSGPHWGWPVGFDRVTRVRTDEVRRIPVGLTTTAGPDDSPDAGEYLTGDANLIRARASVQYRVSDPVAFVLRTAELEPLLTRLAESSLTRALARREIDDALRAGRGAIALAAEKDLRASVDRLGLGVSILGVSLTDATALPAEVAPDFSAAQAARSDRDRRITEARTYQATTIPAANAAAVERIDRAKAYSERTVTLAKARAGRFLALLAEAERSRSLTVRRLYLDALRELLPKGRQKARHDVRRTRRPEHLRA